MGNSSARHVELAGGKTATGAREGTCHLPARAAVWLYAGVRLPHHYPGTRDAGCARVSQDVRTSSSEVISGTLVGRVTACRVGGGGLDERHVDPQHRGRRVAVVAPAVQLGAGEGERITGV